MTLKSLRGIIKDSETKEKTTSKKENILYQLYEQFEELYDTRNLALFTSIRKTFEEKIGIIRRELQIEFLSLLINFGIRQMGVDDEKYNQIVLSLYKLGLEHQLIFTNNLMGHTAYYNIVVCGSKAKDFTWTFNFINTYEVFLPKVIKEDSKAISLSVYYYHRKDFSKAIELFNAHSFKHAMIKITARIHEIRCYYEIHLEDSTYYEFLIDRIDATYHSVRKKPKSYRRASKVLSKFPEFCKKIAKLRISGKLKSKEQVLMNDELSNKKVSSLALG